MDRADIVISVGMGIRQYKFIRKLKEKGYKVAAFGIGKNCAEAIALCDYVAEIDTTDYKRAIEWIDALNVDVIAVGSMAGGRAIKTLQKLSNYYGVSTAIPDELIIGDDKINQQKLYKRLGISTIPTWKVTDFTTETLNRYNENEMFVIKPSKGRGSAGVYIVSRKELKRIIDGERIDKDDIIQIARHGDEYRCFGIIKNCKLILLAPIIRKSYRNTHFLGILSYSDKELLRLKCFFEKFVKSSEIVNSVFKADVLVTEDSIDAIEIDVGVGGGDYFLQFLSKIYDCDMIDEYIKIITDQDLTKYSAVNPTLCMDYVYNHNEKPIYYDADECLVVLKTRIGLCELLINDSHPEKKGGFSSNADFVFTVIHHKLQNDNLFLVDDIANDYFTII